MKRLQKQSRISSLLLTADDEYLIIGTEDGHFFQTLFSREMSEEKFERCVRGEAFRMIVAEARRARESEEAWIKDATALSDARDRNHAEIEKLREPAEKAGENMAILDMRPASLAKNLYAAEAERDRLREAIYNAPHDKWCDSWTEEGMPCDCWKVRATLEEK